jgi:hypothetical protein
METQVLKTKTERKNFLENDFIDRLIRIEQRVSAKYGSLLSYDTTYCYKNLSPKNRERYEKYLKMKKKKKLVFATSFLLPLFGILFFFKGITGNVVLGGVDFSISVYSLVLVVFILVSLTIFIFHVFGKSRRKKKFDPLFEPLENIARGNPKKSL